MPVVYGNPSGDCDLDDTSEPMGAGTMSAQLMTVSPSGSASFTNLPNFPSSSNPLPTLGNVIPDGNGGALAPVSTTLPQGGNETIVADIGGSGGTATISNLAANDMVLGDQGTYFTTDGNQIVDVDEASGKELWPWQPNSGTVEIIAATVGGLSDHPKAASDYHLKTGQRE